MTYTYNPDDKFGAKDTLAEDHPEKKILGVEFDEEFKKIAGAFSMFDPDGDGDIEIGNIDGLQEALDKEKQERIDADADLQSQIDAIDPDGDKEISWDEVKDKPTEFPPEDHTHKQSDIDGLELRLDAIEDAFTEDGGFIDAPDDGKLYGRQSEGWAEVVAPDDYDDTQIKADLETETQARIKADDQRDAKIKLKVEDAPTSGLIYGRGNGAWVEVTGCSGGGTGGAGSVNLAYETKLR